MDNQPVLIQPLQNTKPVPPSTVNITTVPLANPLVTPVPVQPTPPPPLGSELRNKLKVDEAHFIEKSAVAKSDFALRETAEKKEFDTTLGDKGFWERRRLTRAFRAEQAKRRRTFNDEQEAKRRTYEWRYP
jgi:hypothetical protein